MSTPEPIALSADEARRIVLAAQGFGAPRPSSPPGASEIVRAVERLGVLQIDSVNVLVRAHYLPLFARLGPYDVSLLDRAAYAGRSRRLFEYWGHEASLLPVKLQPLFRWRMERASKERGVYGGLVRWARRHRAFIETVFAEVRDRGPLSASELSNGGKSHGAWWGWSAGKHALEWLFWAGRVTTATRRRFERVYDLPERVLPARVLAAPTPPDDVAHRALLRIAARALGIATVRDLRDYFRLDVADTKPRLDEMVEGGELVRAHVEGWHEPAYVESRIGAPRDIAARALLAPFDPLVWARERAERVFGFHYRISLYTPAAERTHGYYVLPFLLGDRLVARVDLKADRQARVLRVVGAYAEAGVEPKTVAPALAAELADMAGWLGLEKVAVAARGDVARALRAAVR